MDVVIGAGITGLALAWRLRREGRDVVVLEASDRPGGVVRSVRRDGLLIEKGPQAFRAGAAQVIGLVGDLGLKDRIVPTHPDARRRFLWWKGRLEALPGALWSNRLLPFGARVRAMAEPLMARATPPIADETVASFFGRRFGELVATRLVDAFVAGVYGGDAAELEIASVFPELVRYEDKWGSVVAGAIRGREKVALPDWAPKGGFTLKDGVETLPIALAVELGDRLRLGASVHSVTRSGAGLTVDAAGGPYDAERVFVCAPGPNAAAFLPELATDLAAIPSARLAPVHLAFRAGDVPEHRGFGWLAPTSERPDALGCIWVSSVFPSHAPGHALYRVMLGGARDPHAAELPDDALIERARTVLKETQGVEAVPVLTDVSRASIPQYHRGHAARLARLQAAIPGVSFRGWGYTGIGLEHCVVSADPSGPPRPPRP